MKNENQARVDKAIKEAITFSGFDAETIREYWVEVFNRATKTIPDGNEDKIVDRAINSLAHTVIARKKSNMKELKGVILEVFPISNVNRLTYDKILKNYQSNPKEYEGRYRMENNRAVPLGNNYGKPSPINPDIVSREIKGIVDYEGNQYDFVARNDGRINVPSITQKVPVKQPVKFKAVVGKATENLLQLYNAVDFQVVSGVEIDVESLMKARYSNVKEVGELEDYFLKFRESSKASCDVNVRGVVMNMRTMNNGGYTFSLCPAVPDYNNLIMVSVFVDAEKESLIDFSDETKLVVIGRLNVKKDDVKGTQITINASSLIIEEKVVADTTATPDDMKSVYEKAVKEAEREEQ